ncbi:MAG TPA: SulP family inorganic anion transporter [Hypericibacter adhaerens]|uniref:Sulfate transporter n=1 Tax=Hypericibacter adhaerens TaxID=2602016 RepID=A0A5J6N5I2_9PROT|nr:SulP family inorganic anion transporter [Hypericibacter adhaerens]QEX24135.1 sulfate transporter [Hypericibacter adhaerens]HWA43066.1 SulP family inorganic anion transporter [Hypericibacter adhaerens]
MQLETIFPLWADLRRYQRDWLTRDVTAGLGIAAIAIPIGIAYPAIMGLPPASGLYATIFPLVAYALFGPSRLLVIGPDTATCTVVASSLIQLDIAATDQRLALATSFAVLVGLLCLLAAKLRLGFIANFLSYPILVGYLGGVALSLLAGQIASITGLPIASHGFVRPFVELAQRVGEVHGPTLLLGLGLFILLRLLRHVAPRLPGPLIAVILGIALSALLGLSQRGVALVGEIPTGLPAMHLPDLHNLASDNVVLGAIGILLVSFSSGIVTARSFAARNNYRVDADQELVGFGAANIASGLFGGFPVTGADSRTAINEALRGRTQLAGIVAAVALAITLLFLTSLLAYLPHAALGAVLASAAIDLFDVRALRRIWRISPLEFSFAAIAILGVVAFGVLQGVVVAIVATLIWLVGAAARPRDALLGRIAGRDGFYKLHRHPEAEAVRGMVLYLLEGPVIFFNSDHLQARIRWLIARAPVETQYFVLDGSAMNFVDGTGAIALGEIAGELAHRGVKFAVADLHWKPYELLERAGFFAQIGEEHVFDQLEEAVRALAEKAAKPPA